jgi:hypothetical protein
MRRAGANLFLLGILLACGCAKKETSATATEKLLPALADWKLAEKPALYTHDNLYDYIDGSCELYFSYGFKGLVSASYEYANDPEQRVTVDIYDMGSPLGAFGVYSSQSHPDYSFQALGCEAIVSSQQIRFWQDRFEVEINNGGVTENSEKLLTQMAQSVAEKLPACQPLTELNWLPQQNQVLHSLKYVADGFLGQDFLPGGFEAIYNIDSVEVRGFVVKCESGETAATSLKKYGEAQRGFQGAELQDRGEYFESYHQYSGHVWAGRQDNWFYGAISPRAIADSRQIAEAIGAHLRTVK